MGHGQERGGVGSRLECLGESLGNPCGAQSWLQNLLFVNPADYKQVWAEGGTPEISFHLYVVLGISTPNGGNQEKLDSPPLTALSNGLRGTRIRNSFRIILNVGSPMPNYDIRYGMSRRAVEMEMDQHRNTKGQFWTSDIFRRNCLRRSVDRSSRGGRRSEQTLLYTLTRST